MDVLQIKNLKDLVVVEQSDVTRVIAFDMNNNLVQGEYKKPDLTGYATEDWVRQELENVQVDLSDYYTKGEVDEKLANTGGGGDMDNYYTKDEIDATIGDINNILTSI